MTAARREEHLGHTNGMSTSRPTGTPPCHWPCQCWRPPPGRSAFVLRRKRNSSRSTGLFRLGGWS